MNLKDFNSENTLDKITKKLVEIKNDLNLTWVSIDDKLVKNVSLINLELVQTMKHLEFLQDQVEKVKEEREVLLRIDFENRYFESILLSSYYLQFIKEQFLKDKKFIFNILIDRITVRINRKVEAEI